MQKSFEILCSLYEDIIISAIILLPFQFTKKKGIPFNLHNLSEGILREQKTERRRSLTRSWHPRNNTFLLPDLNSWRTNFLDLTFSSSFSAAWSSLVSRNEIRRLSCYLHQIKHYQYSRTNCFSFSLVRSFVFPTLSSLSYFGMCEAPCEESRKGRKAYSNVIQFSLLNVDSIIDYVWLLY